jgi:hypothetical protein
MNNQQAVWHMWNPNLPVSGPVEGGDPLS